MDDSQESNSAASGQTQVCSRIPQLLHRCQKLISGPLTSVTLVDRLPTQPIFLPAFLTLVANYKQLGSFLKMSTFPPPLGTVESVSPRVTSRRGCRGHRWFWWVSWAENHWPFASLHSLLPPAPQLWFPVSAVFVDFFFFLPLKFRSKTLPLYPLSLPILPNSSSNSSFIWPLVPVFRSRSCSHALLLLK